MTTQQLPPLPEQSMTHHITDEQIDATSADELLLKVYELLWGEHPECCGNPEAVGYFGDSPAIDCCRCPNYARLNDAQIVASLRALIKESDLMSLLGMRSAKTTPLADWSVDVFDDDEEGRTYINIRNPDDDVAAAGVNTYVVGNRRTLASQVLRGFHQAFRAALTAAPTPPAQSELKTADDDFLLGVCVALQTVTSMDCGVTWRQIVESVGVDDILYYAAWIEPEEWELAGFARYARRELRRGQPPKGRPPLRFAQPTPTAQPAVPESADTPTWCDGARPPFKPGPMDADKAAYFMRRFKSEEKLLGPNEQAAIDFVLSMLEQPAVPEDVARVNQQMLEALKASRAYIARYGYTGKQLEIIDAAIDAARKAGGAA